MVISLAYFYVRMMCLLCSHWGILCSIRLLTILFILHPIIVTLIFMEIRSHHHINHIILHVLFLIITIYLSNPNHHHKYHQNHYSLFHCLLWICYVNLLYCLNLFLLFIFIIIIVMLIIIFFIVIIVIYVIFIILIFFNLVIFIF